MSTLRVGPPLDKVDRHRRDCRAGAIGPDQAPGGSGRRRGRDLLAATDELPSRGFYFPPTLLSNVHPTSIVAQQEIFGPVLAAMTFRTPERGRGTGQQHGLRSGGLRLEREHQRGAARGRADQSGRGLGELHQSVRRILRIWRLSREWLWPRGRQGRAAGISGTGVVQEGAGLAGAETGSRSEIRKRCRRSGSPPSIAR